MAKLQLQLKVSGGTAADGEKERQKVDNEVYYIHVVYSCHFHSGSFSRLCLFCSSYFLSGSAGTSARGFNHDPKTAAILESFVIRLPSRTRTGVRFSILEAGWLNARTRLLELLFRSFPFFANPFF